MCDVMRTLHADLFWGAGLLYAEYCVMHHSDRISVSGYFTLLHDIWWTHQHNSGLKLVFHSWSWSQTHWFQVVICDKETQSFFMEKSLRSLYNNTRRISGFLFVLNWTECAQVGTIAQTLFNPQGSHRRYEPFEGKNSLHLQQLWRSHALCSTK